MILANITDETGRLMEFGEHRDATEFMMLLIKQIQKFVKHYKNTLFDLKRNSDALSVDIDIFKGKFNEYDCDLKLDPRRGLNKIKQNSFKSITINCYPNKSFSELIEMALITEGETNHGKVVKKMWLDS